MRVDLERDKSGAFFPAARMKRETCCFAGLVSEKCILLEKARFYRATHRVVRLHRKSNPTFELGGAPLLVTFFYFIYLSQVNLKTKHDPDQPEHTNIHIQ